MTPKVAKIKRKKGWRQVLILILILIHTHIHIPIHIHALIHIQALIHIRDRVLHREVLTAGAVLKRRVYGAFGMTSEKRENQASVLRAITI